MLPSKRMRASAYLGMLSGADGFNALRFLYKIATKDSSERETVLWAYGEYTKMQEMRVIVERRSIADDAGLALEVRSRINALIARSIDEEHRSRRSQSQKPILFLA